MRQGLGKEGFLGRLTYLREVGFCGGISSGFYLISVYGGFFSGCSYYACCWFILMGVYLPWRNHIVLLFLLCWLYWEP